MLMESKEPNKAAGLATEPPGPGVYEGVPDHTYHGWNYASNSRLSKLKRSPAHLKAEEEKGEEERTPAQLVGTATHHAAFEPEIFAERYRMAGACEASKKTGDRCTNAGSVMIGGRWFCGVRGHAPDGLPDSIIVLPEAGYRAAEGIRRSMMAHPRLSKLLACPGRTELSIVWDDEETGVRCKARIDRLCETAGGVVLDLKTTVDARERAFARSIGDYGYYRQLPMYQDAGAAHGIKVSHLVFAAAEKEPPYAVAGYRLSEDAAELGRAEYRTLIRRYADCLERDQWPAYSEDIQEIAPPAWTYDQIAVEEEVNDG